MGTRFSRFLAAATLSLLTAACARLPNTAAPPNPLPAPSPQGGGVSPGPVNRGSVSPGPVNRGGLTGEDLGGTNTVRVEGPPAAGLVDSRTAGMELGRQISYYVAGLDVTGPGRGGGGGGQVGAGRSMSADMMGAGTTHHDRGPAISTLIVGDLAFVGIDPTDMNSTIGPEGYVRDRVRASFPQLAEVFVTTDPAMVSRIARVTGGALGGRDRVTEITAIMREMTPSPSR